MSDLHSLNDAINKRAGRKLLPSIVVSVSLILLVMGTVKYMPIVFAAVVGVAVYLAVRELMKALAVGEITFSPLIMPIAIAAIVAGTWWGGINGLAVATALVIPNMYFIILLQGIDGFVKRASAATLALIYIGFLGGFLVLLARKSQGFDNIMTLVILVGCNDTFAYVFGVLLGKHKLAPTVSPKKTWEGFIGGLVFTAIGGALAFRYLLEFDARIGAVVGIMGVITATVGDLIESAIKRDLAIKDMGTLLPGHGGMLDRIDSALLTAPALWCALELVKHFS
jgi:phosphatidate cytidylyltransferase